MDLLMMYKYAYWGVIEELKTLMKLYDMCIEVGDGDASDEYLIRINETKSDFDFIISTVPIPRTEKPVVVVNAAIIDAYELRKVDNHEGR